jgi:1,4-alpha-glucan branching enzyme
LPTDISSEEIKNLVSGKLAEPFSLLGVHPVATDNGPAVVARAFLPGARAVTVLDIVPDRDCQAHIVDEQGLFEAILPGSIEILPYRLRANFGADSISTFYDGYSFRHVLTDTDLYLFNQGTHYKIYEKIGAHPMKHQGVSGVLFCVWAPLAARVSVIGDFNQWDGRRHQMRIRGASGVWELFVPHLGPGMVLLKPVGG